MRLKLTTITLTLALVLTLAAGFTLGLSSHVSAQTNGCGPLSKWTGSVCIGPKGTAYCPQGMTMQGQACVMNTPSNLSGAILPAGTQSPVGAKLSDVSDQQQMMKMLTNLTNQVSAQQAQIAQLNQSVIAARLVLDAQTATLKTQAATLTDVQHRQVALCLSSTDLMILMLSYQTKELQKSQSTVCNGTFWDPSRIKGYLSQMIPFQY